MIAKSELFSAYNRMRVSARSDRKQVQRLNKALGILQSKNYYRDERAQYSPSLFSCSCKDWQYNYAKRRNYAGPCKHMIAEQLLSMITGFRAAHDVSEFVKIQEQITA